MAFEFGAQPDERRIPTPDDALDGLPVVQVDAVHCIVQVAAARFRTKFGVRPDM